MTDSDGDSEPSSAAVQPFDVEAVRTTVDRLASAFAAAPWDEEIERARREFDSARGRIFDDDEIFAQHMTAFLEWYTLERPLRGGHPPVIEAFAQQSSGDAEHRLLGALARSYRSLFEVLRIRGDLLEIRDLIRGGWWAVSDVRPEGIERGDLFEARLIPWRGEVHFGPVLLFHPRVARECINRLLDRWQQQGRLEQALSLLAEMRLRYSRFRNIAVEHIYTDRNDVALPEGSSAS